MGRQQLTIRRGQATQLDAHMGQRHVGANEPDANVKRLLLRVFPACGEQFPQTLCDLGPACQDIAANGDQIGIGRVALRRQIGVVRVEALERLKMAALMASSSCRIPNDATMASSCGLIPVGENGIHASRRERSRRFYGALVLLSSCFRF
jgi:hypothetical protein